MLTPDRQRKKRSTFIQLKSATNFQQQQQTLERLGGNIKGCIARLKNLIVEIQSESDVKKIAIKMTQYEKVNKEYNKLQDSLAQIDDNSQLFQKILQMNKQFIQTYSPEELKKKLKYMAAERNQHIRTSDLNEMNYVNQDSLKGQLLYQNKHAVRMRIIEQEKAQLKEIQRLITQISQIAQETFVMIDRQGEVIRLGLQKMKSAKANVEKTRENLVQTNQYQQDTNKKFMIFCCLTVVIVTIVVLIIYASSSKE